MSSTTVSSPAPPRSLTGPDSQLTAMGYTDVVVAPVTVHPSPDGPKPTLASARYQALDAEAHTRKATVLLGHTLDDQAETVLLGLARGSGNRSLAGMAPRSGHLLRPLLGIRRQATDGRAPNSASNPWRDPDNADRSLHQGPRPRGRAADPRGRAGPGIAEALARTAELVRDDADLLDRLAAERFDGKDTLDCDHLMAQPPAPATADHPALADRPRPRRPLAATHHERRALGDAVARSAPGRAAREVRSARCPADLHLELRYPSRDRLPPAVAGCAAWTTVNSSDDLTHVLFTKDQLQDRIVELAAEIDRDYAGKDLLLIGVLNGAVMVMADLSRALKIHCRMDWMAVSSYGSGTQSSGVVRILKDLSTDITGVDVLLVEDIIDTGLTLSYLVSNLLSRSPASLEIMTAFRKPEAARNTVKVAYVGFDIPNEFVVGYGLDYNGRYRNLTSVGTLSPHIYS